MAIKKFFMTFTIIIFVFLIGAGIALIQVINTAEANALNTIKDNIDKGILPGVSTSEENDSTFIDYFGTKPFNALLMVKDKVGSNTDAIVLINLDTINNKITMMWIRRDTYVSTDLNKNGKQDDIMNMVYAYNDKDINKTIDYIGNELGCDIKYGAVMNLNAVEEIVDQLGGVNFNVPALMDYDDPFQDLHIYFESGMHFFNGEEAVKLLRFRQNNEGVPSTYWNGSDTMRTKMQQEFISELIKQKSKLFYAAKFESLAKLVFDNLDTNIVFKDIAKYTTDIISVDLETIEFLTLPAADDANFVHLIPDKEAIKEIIRTKFISLD